MADSRPFRILGWIALAITLVAAPRARVAGEASAPLALHALLGPWQVAGPFPKAADGAEGLATDYLGGELAVHPPEVPGTAAWRSTLGPVVSFNGASDVVSYAWTTFTSPVRQSAVLAVGADDGCRVFLNGQPVLASDRISVIFLDQYRAPVTLEAGENTLLVKVENWAGPSGFLARLLPADALNRAPTLDVRLDEKLPSHSLFQFPDLDIEFLDAAGRPLAAPVRTAGHRMRDEAEEALKGGGRHGGWWFYGPAPADAATVRLTAVATGTGAPLWQQEFPWAEASAGPVVFTPRRRAEGRVVNFLRGEPIAGAKFLDSDWWTDEDEALHPERSGADGSFSLDGLGLVGTRVLAVHAPGYQEQRILLETPYDAEALARVTLHPGGRTVTGRVVDQDGQPVAGARVRTPFRRGSRFEEDLTDKDGRFTLSSLSAGTALQVLVLREDVASEQVNVPTDATEITLTVRRTAAPPTVAGATVGARTGRPLAGVRLVAPVAGTGIPARETVSDAAGHYVLALEPEATGQAGKIFALSDRYEPQAATLPETLAPGAAAWQPFVLRPGQALTGRLVDPQGRPVRGAWVSVPEWEGQAWVLHRFNHTQMDGSFVLPNMPAGPVKVRFSMVPPGLSGKTVELTPGIPQTVALDPADAK